MLEYVLFGPDMAKSAPVDPAHISVFIIVVLCCRFAGFYCVSILESVASGWGDWAPGGDSDLLSPCTSLAHCEMGGATQLYWKVDGFGYLSFSSVGCSGCG